MTQWWAVLCAWGVILLRVGMALHETGSLRSKNSVSCLLRTIADVCIAAIAFWAIGGAIFFKTNRLFFGVEGPMVAGWSGALLPNLLFGATAVFIATGIVGGTLAERSRLTPVLVCSLVLAALVVPVAGLWTQGGWLRRLGFHDLAGASFLHAVGGVFALVGSIFVGPRLGKYNRDGSSNAIPGHSVPLATIGAMIFLAGSMPYLSGFGILRYFEPPMASIGMNALLSAAAGALAAMYISHLRYGKADVHLTYGGLLAGIIAISAGADVVPGWGALIIGVVAGILAPTLALAIDLLWHIDDPTSGIAVHGVGGAWGVIAAGIFEHGVGLAGRWKVVGVQILGLVVIVALAAVAAIAVFAALRAMMPLRASEADEFDGLDLAEHDIGAYPDFQQTMIKSYHLREA